MLLRASLLLQIVIAALSFSNEGASQAYHKIMNVIDQPVVESLEGIPVGTSAGALIPLQPQDVVEAVLLLSREHIKHNNPVSVVHPAIRLDQNHYVRVVNMSAKRDGTIAAGIAETLVGYYPKGRFIQFSNGALSGGGALLQSQFIKPITEAGGFADFLPAPSGFYVVQETKRKGKQEVLVENAADYGELVVRLGQENSKALAIVFRSPDNLYERTIEPVIPRLKAVTGLEDLTDRPYVATSCKVNNVEYQCRRAKWDFDSVEGDQVQVNTIIDNSYRGSLKVQSFENNILTTTVMQFISTKMFGGPCDQGFSQVAIPDSNIRLLFDSDFGSFTMAGTSPDHSQSFEAVYKLEPN